MLGRWSALVGGVTSIPTTALGLLGGVGAGAINGPWVKLSGKKKGEEEVETLEADEKAINTDRNVKVDDKGRVLGSYIEDSDEEDE